VKRLTRAVYAGSGIVHLMFDLFDPAAGYLRKTRTVRGKPFVASYAKIAGGGVAPDADAGQRPDRYFTGRST
jgi:hypothetical protein